MTARSFPMFEPIHVPLTPAQARRVQQLQLQATQFAAMRDAVLSALVEAVSDQDLRGWQITIQDTEIVVTPPMNAINGSIPISPADAMSP